MAKITASKLCDIAASGWAYLPLIEKALPAKLCTPLLILSLPRSGSSWIGSVLGASRSAAYMREPMTTAHRRAGHKGTVFEITDAPAYIATRRAAALAFGNVPRFSHSVLRYPRQWSPFEYAKRRTVIKEVNPLALDFLRSRYEFDILFIVRHPLAIASSFWRVGWWPNRNSKVAADRINTVWNAAFKALEDASSEVVRYEDICVAPQKMFGQLSKRYEIEFDLDAAKQLESSITQGDREDRYSTNRLPSTMADAWKEQFTQAEADAFYERYTGHSPVVYRNYAEWIV
ncbi:MAG: sulfotransferase [Pseudomonadota bacterium]